MIHNNKDEFLKVLERTAAQTGFPLGLLEKDYYITLLLSGINSISEGMIFKGGTCLSKIYYSYCRLSEDLDFSMKLPVGEVTRTLRRNMIKPVKDKIQSFVKGYGMGIEVLDKAGHNESTQCSYSIGYESIVLGRKQSIKLEIGLRFNPFLQVSKQKVKHKFLHPFTREPLFEGGTVNCLAIKELVAEKMRAASTRRTIAPRDFYDLGYLINAGFNFQDRKLWHLFKKKLAEDGFDSDLKKYRVNMGRSEKEIHDMNARIEVELLDVLTIEAKKTFSLQKTLKELNRIFKEMK
jgi:predicted nucleotidyltransferase component of viral defense system